MQHAEPEVLGQLQNTSSPLTQQRPDHAAPVHHVKKQTKPCLQPPMRDMPWTAASWQLQKSRKQQTSSRPFRSTFSAWPAPSLLYLSPSYLESPAKLPDSSSPTSSWAPVQHCSLHQLIHVAIAPYASANPFFPAEKPCLKTPKFVYKMPWRRSRKGGNCWFRAERCEKKKAKKVDKSLFERKNREKREASF